MFAITGAAPIVGPAAAWGLFGTTYGVFAVAFLVMVELDRRQVVRYHGPHGLEQSHPAGFFEFVAGMALLFGAAGGAAFVLDGHAGASSTPTAHLLLAAVAAVRAALLALFIRWRWEDRGSLVAWYALVVDVVTVALAVLGALQVTDMGVLQVLAWANLGVGVVAFAGYLLVASWLFIVG